MDTRLLQIDVLRGLLLIMMTLDHLLLWPFHSWTRLFAHSFGPLGFFSAAEVFFFISGLLIGRILVNKTDPISFLPRIKKLYAANLASVGLLALCVWRFPDFFGEWKVWLNPLFESPLEAMLLTSLFLYLPPFFDILPLYCIFFSLVPMIFHYIKRQSVKSLLCCSFLLWLIAQCGLQQKIEQKIHALAPFAHLGWFDMFAWQFLFVIAVVIGHHFRQGMPNFFKPRKPILFSMTFLCVLCFILRHYLLLDNPLVEPSINAQTLGPLRLFNFLLAAYLISMMLMRWKVFTFYPLAFLGQWSLSTFSYHAVLIYFIAAFQKNINALSTPMQALIIVCVLLSLWLPALMGAALARRDKLFSKLSTHRAYEP